MRMRVFDSVSPVSAVAAAAHVICRGCILSCVSQRNIFVCVSKRVCRRRFAAASYVEYGDLDAALLQLTHDMLRNAAVGYDLVDQIDVAYLAETSETELGGVG